jgi:hypothetical protein
MIEAFHAFSTLFFDPNENGFDIVDAGELVAFIIAISAIIRYIALWARKMLRSEIQDVMEISMKHYTQPIQPGYRNGGESLADLAHLMKRMALHVGLDTKEDRSE